MGNTLWSRLNNRNQKRKSNYEISKKTNIPEEKVKEIMNGDRVLPTERVDDFISAIKEDNKVEKEISVATAKKWIEETDLRAARIAYNYTTQGELAEELGVHSSVICRLENKILTHVSDGLLIKYYDFLHNELNKRVKRKKKVKAKKIKPTEMELSMLNSLDDDEVNKWYNEYDLKEYARSNNISYKDLAIMLGYSKNSTSLVSGLINHTLKLESSGSLIIKKAYALVNGLAKAKETPIEPQIEETEESVVEEENESQEPNEVPSCEDKVETNPVEEYFKVKDDPYEYNFKDNTSTITTATLTDNDFAFNKTVYEPEKITIYSYIWDNLNKELKEKEEKILELEKQVSRYEKLIDMIK